MKKPRHRESFSASHWRDALYPLRKEVLLTQQHCIRKLTKQDSWGELSQCSAVCPLRMGWWLLTSIDSSQPLMKTGTTSRVPRNAQNGGGEQGGLPFVTNPLDSLHKFKSTTRWPTTQPPSLAWSPSPLSFQPLWSTFSPSLPTYLSWRKQRLLKTERQT